MNISPASSFRTLSPAPSSTGSPDGKDYGSITSTSDDEYDSRIPRPPSPKYLETSDQSFTPRSLIVGLLIGVVITFANTYFGLQTGWISSMAMPSSLIGFAVFKSLSRLGRLSFPFTPVENVLVQTVAGAVGTMPLGCGLIGVLPALEYLLGSEDGEGPEGLPLKLPLWKILVWSLGVCMFGAVFAVLLRKGVIIREKLQFPSGTASAMTIRILHGESKPGSHARTPSPNTTELEPTTSSGEAEGLLAPPPLGSREREVEPPDEHDRRNNWTQKIRLLVVSFGFSAAYTLFSYFVPAVRSVPILGPSVALKWLWTLNPSPAYIGQGIIMGPSTTLHMLAGAVLGWGILSPLAKSQGWAPGPVDNWETGSKGWIVWISLAIMLADSIVNFGWMLIKPIVEYAKRKLDEGCNWRSITAKSSYDYGHDTITSLMQSSTNSEDDTHPSQLISLRTVAILLPLTLALNVICIHISFGNVVTPVLSTIATLLALLLSIMGVRALGETDLNPVSGISKLTQLIFAIFTPASTHNRRTAIITNLVAGAVSESGAVQAGDLVQDLKTGHLLGASPKAQFYGQVFGSLFGAVISTIVYKLYTSVYQIPSHMFEIPTAYVWLFTARLVTGQGLPTMAWPASLIAGLLFVGVTIVRIKGAQSANGSAARWRNYVPGGIAVAVGMYNVPSFTLARTIGGMIAWMFQSGLKAVDRRSENHTNNNINNNRRRQHGGVVDNGEEEEEDSDDSSSVIILASGLILGEGVMSIVNLALAGLDVPHL